MPEPEKAPEPAKKDFFDVLFVGLFCFKKTDRVAVMPDGREPADETIPPQIPYFVVNPKDVVASSGWDDNPTDEKADGIYTFGKCTIAITKATVSVPENLDAQQHDANVFPLVNADPSYQFAESNAQTIAEIPLGQGTLELFRRPGPGDDDARTVTRLRVPHEGDIFVTVNVEGEPEPRILALKPRTDIAIVNAVLGFDPAKTGNPFKLFGGIAQSGTIAGNGPFPVPSLPPIPANYQVFKLGILFGEGSGSSGGTGCCPP